MPKIINSMQTGFMKECSIADNILSLINVIDHCKKNNISAIIMSIDFEKAFDTMEWGSIRKLMKKLNFVESYLGAITTL